MLNRYIAANPGNDGTAHYYKALTLQRNAKLYRRSDRIYLLHSALFIQSALGGWMESKGRYAME